MNKKETIEFIRNEARRYGEAYHCHCDDKLKAMNKHNLEEANKYEKWLKEEFAIWEELNYILRMIEN